MALGRRAAASFGVDARVMDDRIHATHCVDLVCDASDLGGAAEIADDNPRGTRREFGDGRGAACRSGVQHHLMAVIKKRLRRRAAEPVRAASDEDDRHPLFLLMSVAGSKNRPAPCDHLRYCSSLIFSIQSTSFRQGIPGWRCGSWRSRPKLRASAAE